MTKRALIVVDMSVEQVQQIQYNVKTLISNCEQLCQNSSRFFDLLIDSRLWLYSPKESSLSYVYPETAREMSIANSVGASLIPELRPFNLKFVTKNNYSCFANSELQQILSDSSIEEVYICGINTDYCVFATALDSFQTNKFYTYVIKDAVSSIGGQLDHEDGLRNCIKHFGENCLVSTKDCC
jgi:nicotinamidase-related amidase